MVVSGAPQRENDHAERVCKMALDMVAAITSLKDPSTGKCSNKFILGCVLNCTFVEIQWIISKWTV